MMKAAPYALPTERNEARVSAMTAARMLMLEKCFDALIDEMIADGAVPVSAAVSMLEHLADRFARRARKQELPGEAIDLARLMRAPS